MAEYTIIENPNKECTLCRQTIEKYATLFYVEKNKTSGAIPLALDGG